MSQLNTKPDLNTAIKLTSNEYVNLKGPCNFIHQTLVNDDGKYTLYYINNNTLYSTVLSLY